MRTINSIYYKSISNDFNCIYVTEDDECYKVDFLIAYIYIMHILYLGTYIIYHCEILDSMK